MIIYVPMTPHHFYCLDEYEFYSTKEKAKKALKKIIKENYSEDDLDETYEEVFKAIDTQNDWNDFFIYELKVK